MRKSLAAQGDAGELWIHDPEIILHFHKDGLFQAARIEHDLFVLFDQQVCQDRQLVIEGKGRDRADHAAAKLLGFFTRRKSGFCTAEMFSDRVQVDAAIAGYIRQAVARLLLPEADHDHDGLDRLFHAVAADPCDQLRPALGLMFH